MAKKEKFIVENCGSKFVLKNTGKPQHYLRLDGKLTPFRDDGTVMLEEEETAKLMAEALNKNQTALIVGLMAEIAEGITKTGSKRKTAYRVLLSKVGLNFEEKKG